MNHVFVDFENVQDIDLQVPDGISLSLVLLVGEKQKSLKTDLVAQLLQRAAQVQLVRLAVSGNNALDLVLAHHVGRAAAVNPTGYFHIVSKDKDFDALVTHLKAQGFKIGRHDAFADLPFLGKPLSAHKPGEKSGADKGPAVGNDKLGEFADNLRRNVANRPKREKTLRSHLRSHFGGTLTDDEIGGRLESLKQRTGLRIDAKGVVDYSAMASTAMR